ncbi:MAG: PIN domain-containing protein [Cyclobacteriaceae bacterium]
MKIFLDANVLVSVANQEYPLFTLSSRILSLADNPVFEVCTSPLCLGITYYFSEKKSGNNVAQKKMKLFTDHLSITTLDQKCVQAATSNPQVSDFEDGMEYYSAIHSGCELIVTEDLNDFHFAEIPITNCEGFIQNFYNQS